MVLNFAKYVHYSEENKTIALSRSTEFLEELELLDWKQDF